MSFGKNLERLRKDHKLSQNALGNALGLTQQMVSSYENGSSIPNLDILLKFAEYFHVSIDYLAEHFVIPEENDSRMSRLINYFESLNESDKDKCITIIETLTADRLLNQK